MESRDIVSELLCKSRGFLLNRLLQAELKNWILVVLYTTAYCLTIFISRIVRMSHQPAPAYVRAICFFENCMTEPHSSSHGDR
jgi:hypothetical protein